MGYYRRIAAVSLLLALATLFVILSGSGARSLPVVARAPTGDAVPAGSTISLTFGRAVDRTSAEQYFTLEPAITGEFRWQGQVMTFRPSQPLQPDQEYVVTLQPGVLDDQGQPSRGEVQWRFRTRAPRLLLVGAEALSVASIGATPQLLAQTPGGTQGVTVSPDGKQLLYSLQSDDTRLVLWLLNLEDGSTRSLIDNPAVSAGPAAWSPAGDLVAFERRTLLNDAIGPPHIWLAQPDGTTLGPIFTGDEMSFGPSWSPDGNTLAFTAGISSTLDLFTFTEARPSFPDSIGEPASWSPDGTTLAYSAYGNQAPMPKPLIRLVQLDNPSQPINLTDGTASATSPVWSPDGQWIAYVQRGADGVSSIICVVRPDGSERRALTQMGDHSDQLPVWSPDSTQIAFVRLPARASQGAGWVVPLTGQAQQVGTEVRQVLWLP